MSRLIGVRSARILASLGLATAALSTASCSDKACIEWSADRGACPTSSQAEGLMDLACGHVSSVDGEGELTDEDLCCYDVTYNDGDSCSGPSVRPPTPGTGATTGAPPTTTGGGSCDGSGFCATCVACAEVGSCADEKLACDSNPSCATLRPCVEACADGNTACVDACTAGHQQGVADLRTLYTCLLCDVCPIDCPAGAVCQG